MRERVRVAIAIGPFPAAVKHGIVQLEALLIVIVGASGKRSNA